PYTAIWLIATWPAPSEVTLPSASKFDTGSDGTRRLGCWKSGLSRPVAGACVQPSPGAHTRPPSLTGRHTQPPGRHSASVWHLRRQRCVVAPDCWPLATQVASGGQLGFDGLSAPHFCEQ